VPLAKRCSGVRDHLLTFPRVGPEPVLVNHRQSFSLKLEQQKGLQSMHHIV
jgi:hypothetical protein